jgi:hypothetical protein
MVMSNKIIIFGRLTAIAVTAFIFFIVCISFYYEGTCYPTLPSIESCDYPYHRNNVTSDMVTHIFFGYYCVEYSSCSHTRLLNNKKTLYAHKNGCNRECINNSGIYWQGQINASYLINSSDPTLNIRSYCVINSDNIFKSPVDAENFIESKYPLNASFEMYTKDGSNKCYTSEYVASEKSGALFRFWGMVISGPICCVALICLGIIEYCDRTNKKWVVNE